MTYWRGTFYCSPFMFIFNYVIQSDSNDLFVVIFHQGYTFLLCWGKYTYSRRYDKIPNYAVKKQDGGPDDIGRRGQIFDGKFKF